MKSHILSGAAALIALVVVTGAAQAQNADWQTCKSKAQELSQAMTQHPDAADLSAVRLKRGEALRECMSGFYRLGIHHYDVALKMLKQGAKS
ncbi:MAG: hypothetical protein KGO02_05980 [Alphaproteobacteria bacterium]|nr:hypothetical protein [Alphaproteobacteria bacterium]